jgi:hypothetical protein
MPPQTAPAPEVVEPDLSVPGLEVQADGGHLPPPPGSAVATDTPEESDEDEVDVEELTEEEEAIVASVEAAAEPSLLTATQLPGDIHAAAKDEPAPNEPLPPASRQRWVDEVLRPGAPPRVEQRPQGPPSMVDSPEYQRLIGRINEIAKRQRAAEKNVLILAFALAFVLYQLQKQPAPRAAGGDRSPSR